MRRVIILCFFSTLCINLLFSQHGAHINSGDFSKRVEYNFSMGGDYNLGSKGVTELLLLGDFNAPVEFFYETPIVGASGFRIVRDTVKMSYILEVKYISNYRESQIKTYKEYKPIVIPENLIPSIPGDIRELIEVHNMEANSKYDRELAELFKIEAKSFCISDQFAEKLYRNMVSFIGDFKAIRDPPAFDIDGNPIIIGSSGRGESVSFRTVVEDEVWSLNIHIPDGNTLKMSSICIQIITDALAGELDEAKFLEILEIY